MTGSESAKPQMSEEDAKRMVAQYVAREACRCRCHCRCCILTRRARQRRYSKMKKELDLAKARIGEMSEREKKLLQSKAEQTEKQLSGMLAVLEKLGVKDIPEELKPVIQQLSNELAGNENFTKLSKAVEIVVDAAASAYDGQSVATRARAFERSQRPEEDTRYRHKTPARDSAPDRRFRDAPSVNDAVDDLRKEFPSLSSQLVEQAIDLIGYDHIKNSISSGDSVTQSNWASILEGDAGTSDDKM